MVSSSAESAGAPRAWYTVHALTKGWILPTAFAVTALVIRLWCFTGLIASDDVVYAHYARLLASGRYVLEAHHMAIRFGLLLPVAGTYALIGVSEATTVVFPVLASVAAVVFVFFIARRQFGALAATIAATLMATFPLSIRYGSILLPETIAELYILAAIWLYLKARDSGSSVTGVSAGVCLGLAYLTRELAVFIVCAVLLEAAWQRRWRLLFAVTMGSLAVAMGEHLFYWLATGDVWFRLHSMAEHNRRPTALVFLEHPGWRFFRAIPHMMLVPSLNFGLHSLAALLLALVSYFVLSWRQVLLFMLWALIPLFYLNFGTTSLKAYVAMPLADRYVELVYPPLFIVSGAVLATLNRKRGGIAMPAAVALLAASGVTCAHATRASGFRTADVQRLRLIARTLRSQGGSIAAVEGPAGWAWSGAMEVLDPAAMVSNAQNSFVLRPDHEGLPVLVPMQP
jgi:4-amino-4-deoxy-L-arabinose transferase-like glycosyltransferase